jgi:N-acetylmuramoyl-L-alanine amidase
VRLTLNILCLTLAAALLAGCGTTKVAPLAMTEVALPAPRPLPVSSATVQTNAPRATNEVLCPPLVAQTNLPPAPRLSVPADGWVDLEKWGQANGLGKLHRLSTDRYALATRQGALVFQMGSQAAHCDGVTVWLGFAPRYVRAQPHLHCLDVAKTLEPLLRRPAPLAKPGRVVVIDPGHGGIDSGTHGTRQQLEKDYALDWALRLEPLLRAKGWKVHLTRAEDRDVSLPDRIALADRVGADLFVSLHFNGLQASASHSGIETFCTTPAGMPSTVTRNLEDNPAQEFPNNTFDRENLPCAFRIQHEILAATKAADGGVRHARFIAVLRGQHRPAVLVEGGFLSNPQEAGRVANAAYRQKLAEAVAKALE